MPFAMHGQDGLAYPHGPCVMSDSTIFRNSFLVFGGGNFSGHQAVDVFGGFGLAVVFEDQEDVGGQPSFFETQ